MNDTIRLTDIDIERCRTAKGGYTRASIEALGLSWPPIAGWPRRLRGKVIARADYERARKAALPLQLTLLPDPLPIRHAGAQMDAGAGGERD